ncbi:hypothetical protein PPL_02173 [Heterostelium album PN500]|uniref:Uncharacterized protein n=1 Tax=Heterostelium pallidum (strain ATCC 26659 / Pp 5 / PN500) TaxID=670386 RepID=D3B1J9_HETP5|nr:hypothetical protein PPL_02173 [Heterostelium album PN500]EFA85173.1 hypothetical protein PPL_02173 [Heterostelium album PN500]|eukprot:XP_020437282.1 hypothetical protein PPL_02173 [Heterostelium album PN500]
MRQILIDGQSHYSMHCKKITLKNRGVINTQISAKRLLFLINSLFFQSNKLVDQVYQSIQAKEIGVVDYSFSHLSYYGDVYQDEID